MSPAQQYRKLAAELRAKARQENDRAVKAEWDHLAQCYLRLAEQAEKNTNVTYEPILRPSRGDDRAAGGPSVA
jgi:hypothetical protein